MPNVTEDIKLKEWQRVAARNQQFFGRMAQSWVARENKRVQRVFRERGLSIDAAKEFEKYGFSLREAGRQLREKFKLTEEATTPELYALTTGLITLDLSNEYQIVDVPYRKIAKIMPSARSEESYFPLQRGGVPQPLGDNEEAPEDSFGGILTRVKNYRFAKIVSYGKTLEADDQTGQVRDQATTAGSKMVYAEQNWYDQQLWGAYVPGNIQSAGGNVPDMNVAGEAPANYGGPTCTPGAVSRDNIVNLWTAADYTTDIEGDFALVNINIGYFANADKFVVKTILSSEFNPAAPSGTEGVAPGIFAENVLKDEFAAYYSRFIKYHNGTRLSGSGNRWGLGEAGKVGCFQDRESLTVIMEVPNAGKSLDTNTFRWLVQRRFGCGGDVLPEFFLAGN